MTAAAPNERHSDPHKTGLKVIARAGLFVGVPGFLTETTGDAVKLV